MLASRTDMSNTIYGLVKMSGLTTALCRGAPMVLSQCGAFVAPLASAGPLNQLRLIQSSAMSAADASGRALPQPRPLPQPAGSGARDGAADNRGSDQAFLRGRWPYISLLGVAAAAALAYRTFREPQVTQRVFLDFEVDGRPAGRVVVGLYGKEAPLTCENFAALASHERGFGYRGCPVHRVMRGWSVWSGDVTAGDGSGGVSVFGPSFGAETLDVRHRRGSVSMVLDEEGRLRSQFFFTLVTTPGLDRKAAAFGRVLEGLDVLERLSRLPTVGEGSEDGEADVGGRPRAKVRVRDSGVLPEEGSVARGDGPALAAPS
ncbi:hypothetical protein PLESTM_000244000 [Pleodorina starrii]|nr:hypothetical protein PLESTM_000244000 [Pleodorina starrii]